MKHSFFFLLVWLVAASLSAQRTAIFLPTSPSAPETKAAGILQHYLVKITGQEIAIISKHKVPQKTQPIFIGNCKAAKKYALEVPADLPLDAYYLQGNKKGFAISGGGEMGAEYGVYSFLELLGCRKYSPRDSLIPSIPNLQLPDYQAKTETPAFPYRELWYEPAFDESWARWHKLKTNQQKNKEWGMFVHTFEKLCPKDTYFAEHPEYFAFNGAQHSPGQLCLSNDTVLQIVVARLREMMAQNPEAKYWSVSQNDNFDYCKCPRCAASDTYYGGPAGTLIAFVNRIAKAFPYRTISTLAYQYTRQAPRNIQIESNVSVCLCSIECNRGQNIEEGCPDFARDVREWSKLTQNLMIWDYVVQFRSYVSPFPNWHTLQPNLQFFQKNGVEMMFEQGSGRSRSEFSDMRAYLLAKLMWNPQANMDSILADFGDGYYGPARPAIWKYIHDQHTRLDTHGKHLWIYDIPQNEAFVRDGFYQRFKSLDFPKADEAQQMRVKAAMLPEMFAYLESLKAVPYNPNDALSRTVTVLKRKNDALGNLLQQFKNDCELVGFYTLNENNYTPKQYVQDYQLYLNNAINALESRAKAVVLEQPASPNYAKGDPNELINKMVGETDYRYNWLGFEGNDMIATVEVEGQAANSIQVSFLQDQQSWVFYPKLVVIEASPDGNDFQKIEWKVVKIVPDGKKSLYTIKANLSGQPVRYVRVTAVNQKTCPAWHSCNGNKSWIFADEILIL
jgi:Domain of unknown function (DUF4838)